MADSGDCLLSLKINYLSTRKGYIFACSWSEISPYWQDLDEDWKEAFAESVRWRAFTSMYYVDDADDVDERRKEWARRCDEMKTFQKECGKARDNESARFFKQEVAEAMKHYRGCCLVLGHLLCEPPGDSPFIPVSRWPLELCDYAVTNMEVPKIA